MMSSGVGLPYVYKLLPIHHRRLPCVLTSSIHVTKESRTSKGVQKCPDKRGRARQAGYIRAGGRRNDSVNNLDVSLRRAGDRRGVNLRAGACEESGESKLSVKNGRATGG